MEYLLALALILLSTKVFGLLTEKVHIPQVVGALVAGVILGPSCIGLIEESEFLTYTAEIGVILIMFTAGLDTDLKELKQTGAAACLLALMGTLVPILGCGAVYFLFFEDSFTFTSILRSAFLGVVFAATSVSITVEALTELGKIKTRAGATLMSAAIIDDIIGIVILSFLTGIGDSSVNPLLTIGKILLFFVFTFIVGLIVYRIFKVFWKDFGQSRRISIWAVAFCFIMAYLSEEVFGVADITGAFFAGVILCNNAGLRKYIAKKVTVASYLIFSPVFFANIGLKMDIAGITSTVLIFALCLALMAFATKVIGCGLSAKLCKMNNRESLTVGVGMAARGEVALMVAQKGINAGYISEALLPAIVICVISMALITPVCLKFTSKGIPELPQEEEPERLEAAGEE